MGSTPYTSIKFYVDWYFGRLRNGPYARERKWGYRLNHRRYKNGTVSPRSFMFWSVLPSISGRYLLKRRLPPRSQTAKMGPYPLHLDKFYIGSAVEQEMRYSPIKYRNSLEHRRHKNRTVPPPARYILSFDRFPSGKHWKVSSRRQDCRLEYRRP